MPLLLLQYMPHFYCCMVCPCPSFSKFCFLFTAFCLCQVWETFPWSSSLWKKGTGLLWDTLQPGMKWTTLQQKSTLTARIARLSIIRLMVFFSCVNTCFCNIQLFGDVCYHCNRVIEGDGKSIFSQHFFKILHKNRWMLCERKCLDKPVRIW